ncbi:MAG: von Willebrand factor type A domain-containing protein [Bacteroidota bacterium]
MNKILFFILLLISGVSFSQTGTIRGTCIEPNTGESVVFITVMLLDQQQNLVQGTQTDIDGLFSFAAVNPGAYNIKIKAVGYTESVHPINVKSGEVTTIKIYVQEELHQLEEIILLSSAPNVSGRKQAKVKEHNTESYDEFDENPFKAVTKAPLSTFSIDVDKASYSNVRRFINDGALPPKDAVRIEELINYFPYDYSEPQDDKPVMFHTAYTTCPWNEGHQLFTIGMQGKSIDIKNAPANNMVFLIDVSGSMQSEDKLDLLKSGLYLLVDQLREQDRVSIVVYAGSSGLVLPSTSGANKTIIKDALERLTAGGSTAGAEGIELAYSVAKEQFIQGGNNRVILATDGDFNVGVSDDGELIRLIEEKRKDDIFLTVLGFGMGNLKDSKMEKLADHGNGNYAYIDDIMEAKKVLVEEMGGTLVTLAKDVKLQLEFNPEYVKAYRLIGYENRMLDDEDFNNDEKDAGDLGAGQTVTAIYEIIPAGSNEDVPSVDSLKYQQIKPRKVTGKANNELLTIKLRYKSPTGLKSSLMELPVSATAIPYAQAPENCKFALSVAAYGMILRGSEHKGTASFDMVLQLANTAISNDPSGYRAGFVELVTASSELSE